MIEWTDDDAAVRFAALLEDLSAAIDSDCVAERTWKGRLPRHPGLIRPRGATRFAADTAAAMGACVLTRWAGSLALLGQPAV